MGWPSGTPGRHGHARHDGHVVHVTRLVTFVDVDDAVADPREIPVSARHEAVLMNGGRVPLLTDRGWAVSGTPDIWAPSTVEEIADTARTVVGTDEPFGGCSQQDMEASHWASLAADLRRQGLDADVLELRRLPHEVVLSEQLLARLGHQPGDGVQR